MNYDMADIAHLTHALPDKIQIKGYTTYFKSPSQRTLHHVTLSGYRGSFIKYDSIGMVFKEIYKNVGVYTDFNDELLVSLSEALYGRTYSLHLSASFRLKIFNTIYSSSHMNTCILIVTSIESGYVIASGNSHVIYTSKDWGDVINYVISEFRS